MNKIHEGDHYLYNMVLTHWNTLFTSKTLECTGLEHGASYILCFLRRLKVVSVI